MQPGEACVACHAKPGGEAPRLAFGGTVYPSAHEPSQCNGADGSNGAKGASVVVIDAEREVVLCQRQRRGELLRQARVNVVPPLKAKVVWMGRGRVMIGAVPSGDCNACHTQTGTTTVTTPGTVRASRANHLALEQNPGRVPHLPRRASVSKAHLRPTRLEQNPGRFREFRDGLR